MPEVYIYAIEGRTIDQKRKLMKEVTEAVARNLDVAEDAVCIQLLKSWAQDQRPRAAFCSVIARRQRRRRSCDAPGRWLPDNGQKERSRT